VELEKEAEVTKAKMAKLEERATNKEVQLGDVEAELTQQAENFKKAEVELIEDALAQVACAHPEMWTPHPSQHRTVWWMGRSCPGYHHHKLYMVSQRTIPLICMNALFSFNYLSCLPALNLQLL